MLYFWLAIFAIINGMCAPINEPYSLNAANELGNLLYFHCYCTYWYIWNNQETEHPEVGYKEAGFLRKKIDKAFIFFLSNFILLLETCK
jgi:hypothetical protein